MSLTSELLKERKSPEKWQEEVDALNAKIAELEEIGQENERAIINAATLFSQAGIGDPDGTLIGIVKNTVKRITELEQTLLLLNGIVAEYDTEQVCHYCGARRKVMGMIEHKENCKFKLAEKRMEELNYALGDKYAIKFIQSDYNNPDSNNPDFNNH